MNSTLGSVVPLAMFYFLSQSFPRVRKVSNFPNPPMTYLVISQTGDREYCSKLVLSHGPRRHFDVSCLPINNKEAPPKTNTLSSDALVDLFDQMKDKI